MADFQVTGNIRIPNAGSFLVRSANDNADLNVLSFDASNNMTFGSVSMIALNLIAQDRVNVDAELVVSKTSALGFVVATGAAVPFFTVDTTNLAVKLGTNPAQSGTFRLANSGSISWRNALNTADIPVLSFGSSDIFNFGDVTGTNPISNLRLHSSEVTIPAGRLEVAGSSTSALRMVDGEAALIFGVDTTNGIVSLSSAAELRWGTDVKLFRDGPWELALRDGLNDNFFYVYGTFTDSSNYERLAVYAGTTVNHFIEPQSAGTGNDFINLTVRAMPGGNLTLGTPTPSISQTQDYKAGNHRFLYGPNGALMNQRSARQVSGALSGASFTFSNIIPAGVLVKAVLTKVTTTITGATGYDAGDGTDVDRWAANVLPTISQGSDPSRYTNAGLEPHFSTAIEDVVITALTSNFTGGEVSCIVLYDQIIHNNIS